MVKDKDITKVLSLLPTNAIYYFTQPDLPRALPVDDLEQMAIENKLLGKSFATVQSAIENAKKNASSNDLILITGSNFVVAEI
jgi:dihydrofolate synthase/folylpolyglutamate synthase